MSDPVFPPPYTGSEADMARVLTARLQDEGWDLYPEVRLNDFLRGQGCPNGIVDLIAVKKSLVMAVEVKKSLGLTVIEQALEWTRLFPLVAIATSASAMNHKSVLKDHLQSHFGLGLYTVMQGHVSFARGPRLLRANMRNVDRIVSVLDERMKIATAGSQASFRMSHYQEFAWQIRRRIALSGPLTISVLARHLVEDHGTFHYSSLASMKQQLHAAVKGYEPDLKLRPDNCVEWDRQVCPHGPDYVRRIEKSLKFARKASSRDD